MIVEGTDAVLGRMFSKVAKRAILGDKVDIINCEKIIISGSKEFILEHYHHRKSDMGVPRKGPFYSVIPEKFCKRIIRGMLPHKMDKGRDALKRIMFYRGVPDEFKDKETQKIGQSKLKTNYVTIEQICKYIGGK